MTQWKKSPIKVHEHSDLKRYKVVQEASFRRNSSTGDPLTSLPVRRRNHAVDILSMMSTMFDDDNDHDHEGTSMSNIVSDDNEDFRSNRRVRFELEHFDDSDPDDMHLMFSTPDVSISLEEPPDDSVEISKERLMHHSAKRIIRTHFGPEKSRFVRGDDSIEEGALPVPGAPTVPPVKGHWPSLRTALPSVHTSRDRFYREDILGLDAVSNPEVRSTMIADDLLLEIRSEHPELVEHLEFLIGFEREVAELLRRRQMQTEPRHQHDEVDKTLIEIGRSLRMPPDRLEALVFQQHEELVRLKLFS